MLVLFIFISKSSVEDFIDKIFPNAGLRMVIGFAGMLYFGYLVLWKTGKIKKWWNKYG